MNGISRFCFAAFAACLFVTTTATAAPPKMTGCGVDFDGDGYGVPDLTRMNGAAAPVPGCLTGTQDCNDADRGVNPGAKEIPGDGIDNDCSAGVAGAGGASGDLTVPPYIKNFGCATTSAGCITRVEAEIAVCKAAVGKCTVNFSGGGFVTTQGNYFQDRDCNLLREVITQAEMDAFVLKMREALQNPTWVPRLDGQCTEVQSNCCGKQKSSSSGAPRARTGTTAKAATVDPKTGERLTAVEGDITALKTQGESTLTVLRRTVENFGELATALQAETDARVAENIVIRTDLAAVSQTAGTALSNSRAAVELASAASEAASEASTSGFNVGLTASVGCKFQAAIPLADEKGLTGDSARGKSATTVLATVTFGGETDTYKVRGSMAAGVPWDEGMGGDSVSGFIWSPGIEWCHKFGGGHCLGVVGRYIDHNSGGTLNGSNAFSRGGGGGLLYDFSRGEGNKRWNALRVTAEFGREGYSTQGDDLVPFSKNGTYGLILVGTGIEFSSANGDGADEEDDD